MKIRLTLIFCTLLIVVLGLIFSFGEDVRRAAIHKTISLADGSQIEVLDLWVSNHHEDGYWVNILCVGSYESSGVDYKLGNLSAVSSPIDKRHFMLHIPVGMKPHFLQKLSFQLVSKSLPSCVDIRIWPNKKEDGFNLNQY